MFDHEQQTSRRLIDVKALAEKLDKSSSSIWHGVSIGAIPKPIKVMGSTRWDEREVDAWLDELLAARDGEEAA